VFSQWHSNPRCCAIEDARREGRRRRVQRVRGARRGKGEKGIQ
jgi:hypothetical protein